MVIKINPAKLALWRDARSLQIGNGREAVHLDHVEESEERLIRLLYRGIANDALDGITETLGVRQEQTQLLLKRLRPALLDACDHQTTASLSDEFVRRAFAEIIRASFDHNVDGTAVLQKRQDLWVHIEHIDRVALALALGLITAGIGRVTSEDESPVEQADIGALGFSNTALGMPKNQALAELISRFSATSGKSTQTGRTRLAEPNLRVHSASHPLTEYDLDRKTGGRLPTLVIELGVETSRVSPVLLHGETPCLDCRNASSQKADAGWASISSQLRSRKERLDDAQSALLCSGFALEAIVRALDARHPVTFEGKAIDHRTGLIELETWGFDRDCDCRKLALES